MQDASKTGRINIVKTINVFTFLGGDYFSNVAKQCGFSLVRILIIPNFSLNNK